MTRDYTRRTVVPRQRPFRSGGNRSQNLGGISRAGADRCEVAQKDFFTTSPAQMTTILIYFILTSMINPKSTMASCMKNGDDEKPWATSAPNKITSNLPFFSSMILVTFFVMTFLGNRLNKDTLWSRLRSMELIPSWQKWSKEVNSGAWSIAVRLAVSRALPTSSLLFILAEPERMTTRWTLSQTTTETSATLWIQQLRCLYSAVNAFMAKDGAVGGLAELFPHSQALCSMTENHDWMGRYETAMDKGQERCPWHNSNYMLL